MRILFKIVLYLATLIVILAAIAFVLPRNVEVARTITIRAPVAEIFPLVNDLRRHSWSPWVQIDPKAKFSYSGPDSGTGQKVNWQSDNESVGTGSQQIVESVANERIETALDFGPQGTATAGFDFAPDGQATKVTWRFKTDVGNNPMMRWMGLMFDSWIGAEYEKGLANLKAEVEGRS